MGQQQLLLVILVTIIVGIATVVAINTFSSAADNANLDAVRNDMAAIASSAQSYYLKPDMLGGGSRTFTGVEFGDIAFPANGITGSGVEAQNENGSYEIAPAAQEIVITANPSSDEAYVPGSITDKVLTAGTDADTQIEARVCPDELLMGDPGESAPACP